MDKTPNPFTLTQDEVYELSRQQPPETVVDFSEDNLISMIPDDYGYKFDVEQSLINFNTPHLFETQLRPAGFQDFQPPVDELLRKRLIERERQEDLNLKIQSNLANIRLYGEEPTTNLTNQKIDLIKEFSRKYGLNKEEEKQLIKKALEKHLLDDILKKAVDTRPQQAPPQAPPQDELPADTGAGTALPPSRIPRRPQPDVSEIDRATGKLLEDERLQSILAQAAMNLIDNRGREPEKKILKLITDENGNEIDIRSRYTRKKLAEARQDTIDYLSRYGIRFGESLSISELDIIVLFNRIVLEQIRQD